MKTALLAFLSVSLLALSAHASRPKELERIAEMQESLAKGGMAGLLAKAHGEGWPAPHMPSRWHVENVATAEQRPVDTAARALGATLLAQLEQIAPRMQQLPAGDELFALTTHLLDLTDWCWKTEGYGNLLLAQRTIDLATVGIARLAYDLTFPIKKCVPLAARLEQPWLSVAKRVRILNKEAGAELFPPDLNDQETLTRMWGTGWFLHEEKRKPDLRKTLQLPEGRLPQMRETSHMRNRLEFFEEIESAFRPKPATLLAMWDVKSHDSIARDAGVYNHWNIPRAKALVAYRQLFGTYPEQIVWTAEQIQANEKSMAEHAKLGVRVSRLESDPEVLRRMGFEQALRNLPKPENVSATEWQDRLKAAGGAWEGYSLVQKGQFLDADSLKVKLHRQH